MTYVQILRTLAKSNDIEWKWSRMFKTPEERVDAGRKMREFIKSQMVVGCCNFTPKLPYSITSGDLDLRAHSRELYSFFFKPSKTVHEYAWE